jgi:cyclase
MKGSGLVKTKRFLAGIYVGDPINAIRIFNDKEADELIVLDVDASTRGKGPDFARIGDFATECFMPLAYGGGIRHLDDALGLVRMGVEKVILNRAMRTNPGLISEIALTLGSSSTVVSIDATRPLFGGWSCYAYESRRSIRTSLADAICQAQDLGAGEVMVTAVHREGERQGPDLQLVEQAARVARVPIVYNGGVRSLQDIQDVLNAGASAVAGGAVFVLHGRHDAVLISYPRPEDIDALDVVSGGADISVG